MMDYLFRCWSFCRKRCPCCCCCCGCCRGRNRVRPRPYDNAVQVSASSPKSDTPGCSCCGLRRKIGTPSATAAASGTPALSGETNLYFQGDEVIFGGIVGQTSTRTNGQCVECPGENGAHEICPAEDSVAASAVASVESYAYEEFCTIIYIQTGRGKQLRIIHVLPNPNSDGLSSIDQKSASVQSIAGTTITTVTVPEEGEDSEEEYWFTRWSRRPRLKNSFKGSLGITLSLGGKDDPTQNSMSCIESRIAKEIEKFQARNPAKLNGHVGGVPHTASQDSSTFPGNSRKSSVNSVDFHNAAILEESVPSNTNGSANNSFTNYGYQPEEKAVTVTAEIKTEADCDVDVDVVDEGERTEQGPIEESSSVNNVPVVPSVVLRTPVCDTGEKSLPLLFFIHGISGSSDVWKAQFEFFHAAGFEIVAPDLLGHGLSSTPKKTQYYLFESLVQDLVHVFDHFAKDDRQAVVIGHGYGACLATVLSRVRPKNVCLLVSVSGGGPTAMAPPASYRKPLLPFDFNLFPKKGITARFDNPDLIHVLPNDIHKKILDGQVWPDGDTGFHRRISVPTLLIYGMRDQVVSLIEECEMERTIPKAFLELIHTAGHMVMLEEPMKLNKMILKFIQSWPH